VVNTTPRLLYPGEKRFTTHGAGGWMGLRIGMDECEKVSSAGIFLNGSFIGPQVI